MTNKVRKTEHRSQKAELRIVAVILAMTCAVMLMFIGINASSSELQYEINRLDNQIVESERYIQNLEVKIKTASNISTIEKKALALGMKYADFDEVIHLSSDDGVNELALALIESVYR